METRFGGHAESARVLSASPQTGERQQMDSWTVDTLHMFP